jgi:hypothetical protein
MRLPQTYRRFDDFTMNKQNVLQYSHESREIRDCAGEDQQQLNRSTKLDHIITEPLPSNCTLGGYSDYTISDFTSHVIFHRVL